MRFHSVLGGESVRFLKKKLTITDAGIKVELNQKYYTQLEKILGGSVRNKKVPCHPIWEVAGW